MDKRIIKGVYRVFDPDGGESYVGYSHNVDGTLKRLRFELALNACSYRPLQEFCNKHPGYAMELMEEYSAPSGMTDEEADAHLMARCLVLTEQQGGKLLQVSTWA